MFQTIHKHFDCIPRNLIPHPATKYIVQIFIWTLRQIIFQQHFGNIPQRDIKQSLQPFPVTCNAPRSKSSPFFTNVHTSFCLRPESSIKAIIALFLAVSQGTEHFAESNKYCISAEESTWTFFLGGLGTFIFTGSKLRPYSACTHLRNIRAFLTYVEIWPLGSGR